MKGNKIGEGIGSTSPHIARSQFLYCLTTVYFCRELPVHRLGTHRPTPLSPLLPQQMSWSHRKNGRAVGGGGGKDDVTLCVKVCMTAVVFSGPFSTAVSFMAECVTKYQSHVLGSGGCRKFNQLRLRRLKLNKVRIRVKRRKTLPMGMLFNRMPRESILKYYFHIVHHILRSKFMQKSTKNEILLFQIKRGGSACLF